MEIETYVGRLRNNDIRRRRNKTCDSPGSLSFQATIFKRLSLAPALPTLQRQRQVTFPPARPLAITVSSITAKGLFPRKHHRTHSSSSSPISPPHYACTKTTVLPLRCYSATSTPQCPHLCRVLDAGEEKGRQGSQQTKRDSAAHRLRTARRKNMSAFALSENRAMQDSDRPIANLKRVNISSGVTVAQMGDGYTLKYSQKLHAIRDFMKK